MSTPLGLARELRLSFPEFLEVRVVREGPYRLRAYCAISDPAHQVPGERLVEWARSHVVAGAQLEVDQVQLMPQDLHDEEKLLQQTSVPRVVAETASPTAHGLVAVLRNLFPTEVLGVVGNSGHVTVQVHQSVPTSRDQELLATARLLMGCDPISLHIARQAPTNVASSGNAESSATYERLAEDRALLHDQIADAFLTESLELPPLPSGSSTYASPHDGITSLLQRLALFERVYVYVPFNVEDFPSWAGAPFDEFLAALPTGRIIPVFGQRLDRYEPGLMTKVLEAGAPRAILQGEHALRTARSFRADYPLLPEITSDAGTQVRLALAGSNDDRTKRFLAYLDALAEIMARMQGVAINGDSLVAGIAPLADWVDVAFTNAGHASRALEIGGALEHRAITESFGGVPMMQAGHYFDSCLRFVYGAEPGNGNILRVPDPKMIGRICFPDTTGLTVREFAESFSGAAVDAMRELMLSKRVQSADGSTDLVRTFNEELKVYARRAKTEYAAIATVLTVVGAFAVGVPIALATLTLELARQLGGSKAPAAFATLTSRLTHTTREAALLARVKNQ
jgi:hypothetical protein